MSMGSAEAYYAYLSASGLTIQALSALVMSTHDRPAWGMWFSTMKTEIMGAKPIFDEILKDFPITKTFDECVDILGKERIPSPIVNEEGQVFDPLVQSLVPMYCIEHYREQYNAAKQILKMLLDSQDFNHPELVEALQPLLHERNTCVGYFLDAIEHSLDLTEAFAAAQVYVSTQTNLTNPLPIEDRVVGYQAHMAPFARHSTNLVWISWAITALIECNILAIIRNTQ